MLNVTCPRAVLHEAVQNVARGVTGRSTRPVQNDIYLEAGGDGLRLVATDLETISIETVVRTTVAGEGAVTVPPRVFSELTGSLPDELVSLTEDEGHSLVVQSGGSRYTIRGRSAADFQRFPEVSGGLSVSVPAGVLHNVVRQTVFATSRDETRPILTGALFQFEGPSLLVVATDTYRLALRKIPIPTEVAEPVSAIVSARALHELLRIVEADSEEPVEMTVSESQVRFVAGDVTIASRLIEGQFPNYQKVIPERSERKLTLGVSSFESALRRALIVAREDSNRVVLDMDKAMLRIRAESSDVGKVEEEVSGQLEGEPLAIAFNARYLLDALEAVTGTEVTLELSGSLNPGIMRSDADEDYLYVLMPMQIPYSP